MIWLVDVLVVWKISQKEGRELKKMYPDSYLLSF